MSGLSSTLSADAPAWYPSTYFEAAIEACPAEPPSVAEEAKEAPVSPATSGDTVALQATVDSGRDGDGATNSRGSVPHIEVVGRGEEVNETQIPTRGASAGATVAPVPSHTGLLAIQRDVMIARDISRAELLGATAVSDPGGSDASELRATSPEGHSSSTARRRLTRGQLWGLGVAALSAVVLVVGLSRRRRAG